MRQGLINAEEKPKAWRMFLALGVLASYAMSSVSLPSLLHSACPGKFIGMNVIWILVVSLLATYNITKAID